MIFLLIPVAFVDSNGVTEASADTTGEKNTIRLLRSLIDTTVPTSLLSTVTLNQHSGVHSLRSWGSLRSIGRSEGGKPCIGWVGSDVVQL